MENTSILDKLTPASRRLLKALNKKNLQKLDKVRVKEVVSCLELEDSSLKPFLKVFSLKEKLEEINFEQFLINAYNEAMLMKSDSVDLPHFILSLLNLTSTKKYYEAKTFVHSLVESRVQDHVEGLFEDLTNFRSRQKKSKFIGRESEITKLMVKLSMKSSKPILLIGSEGIGKTSLMKEVGRRVRIGDVPKQLKNTRIIRMKFSTLLSIITMDGGGLISNSHISNLMNSIANIGKGDAERVILFLDDLRFGSNFMLGVDNSTQKTDVLIVGAMEDDVKDRLFDSQILKMWDIFNLKDPSEEEIIKILKQRAKKIKKEQGYVFKNNAIKFIASNIGLESSSDARPGSALKFLDLMAVYKSHRAGGTNTKNTMTIDEADVIRYLSLESEDEPTLMRNNTSNINFKKLEQELKKNIVGQDQAIETLLTSLKISSLKLLAPNRPIGSFLFLGPTGIGKSQTAKVLATALFGYRDRHNVFPDNFLRIDMSEYSEKHSVAKLFGAPPGYVGFDDGGILTEFVKDNSNSVILFDEIDKAHIDVLTSLLHIMEEGEVRDSTNDEYVSFADVIIIMTSNHGVELLNKMMVGFGSSKNIDQTESNIEEILKENLKRELKPEFLNRFDDIVVFHKLTHESYIKVLDLLLKPVVDSLRQREIKLRVSKSFKNKLVRDSKTDDYGAREIRRSVTNILLKNVSDLLLNKSSIKEIRAGVKSSEYYFKGIEK